MDKVALLGLKQRRMLISMDINHLSECQAATVTARDYFLQDGEVRLTDEYTFTVTDIDEIKAIQLEYQEQMQDHLSPPRMN